MELEVILKYRKCDILISGDKILHMMEFYKIVGERIALIRTARGYTREVLAELADISPKFLYEIECGKKKFSAGVLYNICNGLKVDCDYILSGHESKVLDKKLLDTILLFKATQTERLTEILIDIYKLL